MGVIGTVASNLADAASQKLFSGQVRGKVGGGVGKLKDKSLAENVVQARKDYNEAIKGLEGDALEAFNKSDAGKGYLDAIALHEKNRADQISSGIGDMWGGAKDWLTGADAASMGKGRTMTLAKRYGALAGGSVALGTGARMLNGGTLTQDNRGRNDIAGIPFI